VIVAIDVPELVLAEEELFEGVVELPDSWDAK